MDSRVADLEARLLKVELEDGQQRGGSSEVLLLEYKIQLVGRLKEVRDALLHESGSGGGGSGDNSIIVAERDALKAENASMRKEIDRLNYRVAHLIKALNEEEKRP